jgi:hypothetical protein
MGPTCHSLVAPTNRAYPLVSCPSIAPVEEEAGRGPSLAPVERSRSRRWISPSLLGTLPRPHSGGEAAHSRSRRRGAPTFVMGYMLVKFSLLWVKVENVDFSRSENDIYFGTVQFFGADSGDVGNLSFVWLIETLIFFRVGLVGEKFFEKMSYQTFCAMLEGVFGY